VRWVRLERVKWAWETGMVLWTSRDGGGKMSL
jgi:hypothetical protein